MKFCPFCGVKLIENAKFCSECGASLNLKTETKTQEPKPTEKQAAGSQPIKEKPGEQKAQQGSLACKQLVEALEKIVPKKPGDGVAAREKLNLISNFVVPETKTDILEFLSLADSMLKSCTDFGDVYTYNFQEAWRIKYEEAYTKAKALLWDDADFQKIKEERKAKEEAILMQQRAIIFEEQTRNENDLPMRLTKILTKAIGKKEDK